MSSSSSNSDGPRTRAVSHDDDAANTTSWLRSLKRGGAGGGWWDDCAWYDAHLAQRIPLHPEMLRQLALVLPPQRSGDRVLDWLGGSGSAAEAVARLYPAASYTVLDSSRENLDRARARFTRAQLPSPMLVEHEASIKQPVPEPDKSSYQLILAVLALHHMLEHEPPEDSPEALCVAYSSWVSSLLTLLSPGGHLFIADHVGQLSCFRQMQLLHQVGFVDVEVAWRVDDMAILGARRPKGGRRKDTDSEPKPAKPAQQAATSEPVADSPSASATPSAASSATAVAAPAAPPTTASPAPAAEPVSAAPMIHAPHPSLCDDDQINAMIAALQAQNEDLQARLAAASQEKPTPAASETSSAPAGASSSLSSGDVTPALLAKIPQLFSRFDPSRSGQLSFHALQALCRAVGRASDADDDSDGESSLWWTYQSVAEANSETGQVGLSIEDLTVHFYKSKVWPLENDLRALGLI